MKDTIRKLCGLLKLDAAAFSADGADTVPVFTAALQAIEAAASREGKLLLDLKPSLALTDTDTLDTLAGKLLPILESVKSTAAALTEAQGKLATFEVAEKGRLIETLKADGKLTEAMLPWAQRQTVVALTDWAATAPVVVQRERIVTPEKLPDAEGTLVLSDNAKKIAIRCGLDPAKVAAANGLKAA